MIFLLQKGGTGFHDVKSVCDCTSYVRSYPQDGSCPEVMQALLVTLFEIADRCIMTHIKPKYDAMKDSYMKNLLLVHVGKAGVFPPTDIPLPQIEEWIASVDITSDSTAVAAVVAACNVAGDVAHLTAMDALNHTLLSALRTHIHFAGGETTDKLLEDCGTLSKDFASLQNVLNGIKAKSGRQEWMGECMVDELSASLTAFLGGCSSRGC